MIKANKRRARIFVFDSGVGGLSVLRELIALYGNADYHYYADNALFPYGDLSADALQNRVLELLEKPLGEGNYDLCVIACNTASTQVLPILRTNYELPFVGTVPAIKPACQKSKTGLISVLATPAAVSRDYTHNLIREFASRCRVNLVGAPRLAELVEEVLAGGRVS
ncbi:hypothetical protein CAPTEDRAFT_143539, partial [Capitella teleta]